MGALGQWVTGAPTAVWVEMTNNANCTTQAAGQLVCGVVYVDNAFYVDVYNGSWSTWTKVGGTRIGIPSCAALGTGQVVYVVMGVDNKLTSVVGPQALRSVIPTELISERRRMPSRQRCARGSPRPTVRSVF
jgi:hypothetical protein